MDAIRIDIARFSQQATKEQKRAGARLSLQLLCGEDLDAVIAGGDDERKRVVGKLAHRLERERQKGLRGHWSYDLNRHIGLRQALDLIVDAPHNRRLQGGAQKEVCV